MEMVIFIYFKSRLGFLLVKTIMGKNCVRISYMLHAIQLEHNPNQFIL